LRGVDSDEETLAAALLGVLDDALGDFSVLVDLWMLLVLLAVVNRKIRRT
jgi:hypothetical protein